MHPGFTRPPFRNCALATCIWLCATLWNTAGARADASGDTALPPAEHRLSWNPEWPRFRPIGYALMGASVLGALTVTLFIGYPHEPRWTGGILFDDATRTALRARNPGLRDGVRTASDVTLALSIAQIALVDSLILPLADGSPDVAAQLTLINAQALSLNVLIATLLFKIVARERPLIKDCKGDPNFDPLCKTGADASFPSSHTSTSFTAAGLTCVHHAYLPIYGGPWDMAACAEALAIATATGVFRIVGDRHYASDVIFGAAIGFSIGYLYPWLLHYRTNKGVHGQRGSNIGVVPVPPYGLGVAGSF